MASRMFVNASSSVAPCDQQPGSPGARNAVTLLGPHRWHWILHDFTLAASTWIQYPCGMQEERQRLRTTLWIIAIAALAILAVWLDRARPFPAHVIRNGPHRAAEDHAKIRVAASLPIFTQSGKPTPR